MMEPSMKLGGFFLLIQMICNGRHQEMKLEVQFTNSLNLYEKVLGEIKIPKQSMKKLSIYHEWTFKKG